MIETIGSGPGYYISVTKMEIKNNIFLVILGKPKIETKEVVDIITSSDYYNLDGETCGLYRPLTIGDAQKYGNDKMKKRADTAFVEKLIGL